MTSPSDSALAPEPALPPTSPMTENTFVATAAGNDDPPAPIKGLRRLLGWIIPANLGIFLIWGAVPGILLPQQVTVALGEENKVANLAITLRADAASVSGRYDIVLVVQRVDEPAVSVEHATRFFAPEGASR